MTNIPEDVMKTARELIQEKRVGGDGNTYYVVCPTPTRIARAIMEARDKALDEAAVVAANDSGLAVGGNVDFGPNVAARISAAIRAMKSTAR